MNTRLVDGAINIITYSGDAPGFKKIVGELEKGASLTTQFLRQQPIML